ncbi:hypothetical protein V8E53_008051 [Lactarius tabidus]
MSIPNPFSQPSFLLTYAIMRVTTTPHPAIAAGTVAVLRKNPLDLVEVKFQVSMRGPEGGIGRSILRALCGYIHANEGWHGMYRVLVPKVAGNASSWGLYFIKCVSLFPSPRDLSDLIYNQLKPRATDDAPDRPLLTFRYLLFSSEPTWHTLLFLQHSFTSLSRFCSLGTSMTAIFTNPIWVTNVQTFTAPPNSPTVHLGLGSGFLKLS